MLSAKEFKPGAINTLRPTAALWRYLRWDAGIFKFKNPKLSRIPLAAIVGRHPQQHAGGGGLGCILHIVV